MKVDVRRDRMLPEEDERERGGGGRGQDISLVSRAHKDFSK